MPWPSWPLPLCPDLSAPGCSLGPSHVSVPFHCSPYLGPYLVEFELRDDDFGGGDGDGDGLA
jgi:hypothetical protein